MVKIHQFVYFNFSYCEWDWTLLTLKGQLHFLSRNENLKESAYTYINIWNIQFYTKVFDSIWTDRSLSVVESVCPYMFSYMIVRVPTSTMTAVCTCSPSVQQECRKCRQLKTHTFVMPWYFSCSGIWVASRQLCLTIVHKVPFSNWPGTKSSG